MKTIDPGHAYELAHHESGTSVLTFIKKEPVSEGSTELKTVHDGTTTEEVLQALANRLDVLQERVPDMFTKAARYFIGQALHQLQERSIDRKARGVKGTNAA